MKKQLLTGVALLAAVSAYPQNSHLKVPAVKEPINMAEKLAQKYMAADREVTTGGKAAPASAQASSEITNTTPEAGLSAAPAAVSWQAIGGSMNIFGVLVSQSKPLHFNDNLNAIAFIHRKGNATTTQPVSNTGSILARISNNWGATWDSTCIWADNTNWARYPQGGIYNPSGGTNMSNAYVVGMGPVTDPVANVGWKGNWYGSRQLGAGNYNLNANNVPAGSMQYIANTPPYNPGLAKHDFSRYSFTSTDDGVVRSIAGRYDAKDNTGQPTGFRGAAIVKGTFAGGAFVWTSDTIIPNTVQSVISANNIFSQPVMAWNEQGNIGYVCFIGATPQPTNAPAVNKGWQPIVYKTTNSGNTWVSIPGIDFSAPTMTDIPYHLYPVQGNTNLAIPFFSPSEGFDVAVDAAGKLHWATTVVGSFSDKNDSLAFTYQIGPDKYSWGHNPGDRPYLYDFITDGSGPWTHQVVDTIWTEGAGAATTAGGYSLNLWDADPSNQNAKVTSDSRIQLSRTQGGDYIVYSWAESDTMFVTGQKKFNVIPNIKARCVNTAAGGYSLSPTKINVTRPATGINANIANRAMFHYMAPECAIITCTGAGATSSVQIRVPFTVSNSNPYSQLGENKHWFSGADLDFGFVNYCTGVSQNLSYLVNNIEIYPNPAHNNATVAVELKEMNSDYTVSVYNLVGQLMMSTTEKGQVGLNKIDVNVSSLTSGVYMINVKVGNTVSTKKLIIE